MPRLCKYSKEILLKATMMKDQGRPIKEIMEKTGLSRSQVYYHCQKGFKELRKKSTYKWMSKNKEAVRRITDRASKKWRDNNHDKYLAIAREGSKRRWKHFAETATPEQREVERARQRNNYRKRISLQPKLSKEALTKANRLK